MEECPTPSSKRESGPGTTPGPSPSYTATIEQASALLATDPASALRQAMTILTLTPQDPRAILILGSAQRRLGDPAAARALLVPLAMAHPKAAHTHYELGLTLAVLGETSSAIAALRHAVSRKPDLAEAWRALGDQLFLTGDTEGADAAFAEHARALVTDPALKGAADALFHGRVAEAERRLRAHLTSDARNVEALRLLADAVARQGRDGEAESFLAHCLELDPSHEGTRFSYATVLFRLQKGAEAVVQIEGLFVRNPKDPAYRNLLAACLALVGDYERAIKFYEGLLADYGRQPKIWLNYGHALRTIGRYQDTVAAFRRCIDLAPGLGEAYWSLANLKTASFSPAEEAAMAAELERPDLAGEDRLHLHYARGKALEDRGDHAAAFQHYARGAQLRRAGLNYDADEMTASVRRSKALFTRAFFEARAGGGSPSNEPIFIVGLPRSGSTLIEQILACHSSVEGTMELPDISFIAGHVGWPGRSDILTVCSAADLAALGETFLARTRIHRKLGRPFFIDKMPNNFRHIGLIRLILPNARIIDARRHPMGSCFSAFKQHFARGHAFSYSLTDLGRYYRDYVEWMAHIDEVLPGYVHRVIYENVVSDTESEIRRLLDFCGLPFEEACLKFYENDRAVRTVSSEQVRRPIFRDGLDQWRHYEPWLGPLKEALGPALEHWRGCSSRTTPAIGGSL
jgi:predicted Zn-dependent protease